MQQKNMLLSIVLVISCLSVQVLATQPRAEEMEIAKKWTQTNLGSQARILPFSFIYDGKSSADLLKTWEIKRTCEDLDNGRTQHTIVYTDSKTRLQMRCVIVEYKDFPTVEWTLYFKNTGLADTAIIEKIRPLDIQLKRNADGEFVLRHQLGSACACQPFIGPLKKVYLQ